jgi:hypothetical protein
MTDTCQSCAVESGTKRYCAPARCYCGHKNCPAFDSWVDLKALPIPEPTTTTRRKNTTWDDREGPTWIDSL